MSADLVNATENENALKKRNEEGLIMETRSAAASRNKNESPTEEQTEDGRIVKDGQKNSG